MSLFLFFSRFVNTKGKNGDKVDNKKENIDFEHKERKGKSVTHLLHSSNYKNMTCFVRQPLDIKSRSKHDVCKKSVKLNKTDPNQY